jgi:hypothetical protein
MSIVEKQGLLMQEAELLFGGNTTASWASAG